MLYETLFYFILYTFCSTFTFYIPKEVQRYSVTNI